ncbi:PstS family phosphate ABC transporter substrate-binding protein [Salinivibrio sp. VYel1]|uniref:PstS family phosphate ABC transporter substrate-binding protein n=1 Tax=Salinivibrio sp. VYel1 TaxID=2490490 RepID=UPI00128D3542|nr:phosphate ABC transporter substrate-binding protein PstS family protein [Salinivibrio sp. VYel1]MPX91056.1 phosphate ABC transporter substrate-binding protein PstS family protein [Salinivibrio sp. VYel1]
MLKRFIATASLLVSMAGFSHADTLPDYQRSSGISGNLSSVGSDTLANMMAAWTDGFKRLHPGVNIQLQTPGSASAAPALVEGTAQLGPMSRPMRVSEENAFQARFGYPPTAVPVAVDAMAVYVHQDNPLRAISFQQLDAVFSRTLWCGASKPVATWGQLGLSGRWANRDLQLFGRNSVSGTYGYFKQAALCRGDFRADVNEQPGSASVVQSVASSLNAIGYAGIGHQASGARMLAISHQGKKAIKPTPSAIRTGEYPLTRYLYLYINKAPNQPLAPLESAFMRYILSAQGQKAVSQQGYIPLPAQAVRAQRQALGLDASLTDSR